MLQTFLRGLQPSGLREHVRLASSSSLTAVVEEAEKSKAVLKASHALAKPSRHVCYAVREEDSGRTYQVQGSPQQQATKCFCNGEENKRAERAQGFLRWQQRRFASDGCYCCGEPGHIARSLSHTQAAVKTRTGQHCGENTACH